MIIQRTGGDNATLQFSGATVTLKPNGFLVNDYVIDMPGEFDVAGISFDVGEGFSVVNADKLRLLVIFKEHPALSLDAVSSVEDVDLVVVTAETDQKHHNDITSIMNDLEPHGIAILGTADDAKSLTGKVVEATTKAKIVNADLEGEDLCVWAIA